MIYIEYEVSKKGYYDAQKRYEELLNKKERMFDKTQPASVGMGEKVSGGVRANAFDSYVIEKEESNIDAFLKEARDLLKDREVLVEAKRRELEGSNNIFDKVYYYRYVLNWRVKRIARQVGYSEAQAYRILKSIKSKIALVK